MTDCENEGFPERRKSCQHAEEAANLAVKKVFAILGVDIHSPKEVEQFRISLRFGDQLRKAADKGFITLIVVAVTALGAVILAGLKHEYEIYHGKPEQIKRRTERNAARRTAVKAGKAAKGDGKDVHHKNGNTSDSSTKNISVISRSKNRAMGGASSKPYTRTKRSK
jgi:hypothetical protein